MIQRTPLRYPGGKSLLASFFESVVQANHLSDGVYVEAFAGGAGVGIGLLLGEFVDSIHINDVDTAIWAFWKSVVEQPKELCDLIKAVPLTVDEWQRQKIQYSAGLSAGTLQHGFAMFYLNRTNRSGILNAGIIGGKNQTGEWKIDARFNKEELIDRIKKIARYRSRIHVTCEDAVPFLARISRDIPRRTLVYLDPPYYVKGQHLYRNFYSHDDHVAISETIQKMNRPWVVSYDNHPQIRKLYRGFRSRSYELGYSARDHRLGSEVMFFSQGLNIPRWHKTSKA